MIKINSAKLQGGKVKDMSKKLIYNFFIQIYSYNFYSF